jgi:DNA repair protein RecO (recombination protein O)
MEETYSTKAIILNRMPFREADEKVVLYTEDYGKIDLVAKGAKKNKSKLAGHIEPLNFVNLMVIKGRQYDYLGSAINSDAFVNIKNDLNKIAIAGRSIKFFNEMVKVGEKDKNLFIFLMDFLSSLNTQIVNNIGLTYEVFVLKLLCILGYQPELGYCQNCRKKIENDVAFFIFNKGGLVCENCLTEAYSDKIQLSFDSIKVLRIILDKNFKDIFEIIINQKNNKEIKEFISTFSQFNI